ncbi:MAG: tetratricopeptide repeat protein [candidate division KSB1 bacterium]|nr:tetratricopeptide repeat protein [candidate division KSB1 bacterium]MDZ7274503.1 tetratricopeptide repeat protein [candidate division KSB1 bacterium]MDZ7284836.1 tetratricopeptide repeat protein [candidate division KSB1 bacterium]MDZ7297744.1 tetratricopeptide repeat protein [candidate division KSB1 bacterium]MDZ7307581.1 tetratricopeptide repeat protein [candidate division KSB1 bacterium]
MSTTRLLSALFAMFLLVTGCGEKLNEEQLYSKARELELRGEFAKAESYYKKLNQQYPQNAKFDEAQTRQALLQKANTLGEDALRNEIKNHESRQEFDSVLLLSQALVKRFPKAEDRDEVLQRIGMLCLNHEQQYQRAVDAFQKLVSDFPQSRHVPQAQFMIGYIYANHIKDLDRARTAYTIFKQKYPDHELVPSVEWELEHLGQDVSELNLFTDSKDNPAADEATSKKSPAGPNAKP